MTLYLHEYADASIALNTRCAALLERARTLAKREDATLPVYAVRAFMTEIVRNREGLDARNTLVDAAYGNANAYLTRSQEHALAADKIIWCLEDLAETAKRPPTRAIGILDAPEQLARLGLPVPNTAQDYLDAALQACDAYDATDFHAILTRIDTLVAPEDKLKGKIRDARDLMYLEVTRNSGALWGKPRADWFRREFAR